MKRFLIITFLMSILFFLGCPYESPSVQALPDGARQIREHRIDMFIDHAYLMKARVDAEGYKKFVDMLEMNRDELTPWLEWSGHDLPEWWDAPSGVNAMHSGKRRGEKYQSLYVNSWLYFQAWSE